MYEELKARLKHVARLEAEDYGAAPEDHASHQAAEAIEQLERQLAERDAEIAKYFEQSGIGGDCLAESIRSGEWRKFVKEV